MKGFPHGSGLADKYNMKTHKQRYFGLLCENGIIDTSDKSKPKWQGFPMMLSQLDLLGNGQPIANGEYTRKFLEKIFGHNFGTSRLGLSYYEGMLKKLFKKPDVQKCYQEIGKKDVAISDGRGLAVAQLDYHAFKSDMLTDKFIQKCSEMSILAKYWSPLFEFCFGENRNVFLQWGDTVSVQCKRLDLGLKLDLRMVLETEQEELEAVTGEVASAHRLKSTLATKCHLDTLLSYLQFIPPNKINTIRLPIIQIMGLDCTIYSMSLVDKQLYMVEVITEFTYPCTITGLRKNSISKLITGLDIVNMMMTTLEHDLAEYSRNTTNKMQLITRARKSTLTLNIEYWTSDVSWCATEQADDESVDSNESDDADDSNDDDESDGEDNDDNQRHRKSQCMTSISCHYISKINHTTARSFLYQLPPPILNDSIVYPGRNEIMPLPPLHLSFLGLVLVSE